MGGIDDEYGPANTQTQSVISTKPARMTRLCLPPSAHTHTHTCTSIDHARRHVQLIGERRQTQQRFAVQQRLERHAGAARAQDDADGRVRDDRQRREVGLEAEERRDGRAEQRAVFAATEAEAEAEAATRRNREN